MADSAKLWWLWRKRSDRVLVRSLPQFSLAFLCAVGSIAASISSSYVVSSSDLEVLVSSPLCGHVNSSQPINAFRAQSNAIRSIAAPYAQGCYRNTTVLPVRCQAFVRPYIAFTSEKVACPFNATFCMGSESDNHPAVAVDSGLIDLNDGFGLNLPKRDRVSYRRRTTCTVLPVVDRTSILNASDFPARLQSHDAFPGEQVMLFHDGEHPSLGDWKNTTMFLSLVRANMSSSFGLT